jgi:hypothetical protein
MAHHNEHILLCEVAQEPLMNKRIFSGLILAFSLLAHDAHAQTRPVTVIELFTSQGCSSCPPANANLTQLARRPEVLALSFGVNYWDYLGWRDTFASQAFTERQRDYARGLGRTNVYTPQMVINGRIDTVGARMGEITRLAASLPPLTNGPTIALNAGNLSLGAQAGLARPASIWLVRYDPRVVQVPVQRGENSGKTLPHVNVVREMVRLSSYDGRAMSVRLPATSSLGLSSAIIVQAGVGGQIIAAAKL